MEFVILNTVSQHGLSTESSIVWVKHSVEHLILYGKSHVNLYLSILFYFRMVWKYENIQGWSRQPSRDGFWPHLFWHIDIKDIFVPLERRSWTQHHQSDLLMQTGRSSSFDREVTSLASHCTQDTTKNLATPHSFVGHYSEYWLTLRQRFVAPITLLEDSLAHS